MKVIEVVKGFLRHYEIDGYKILPGGSLVDYLIPQAFVMSVGLSQFENASLEQFKDNKLFALCQNCFRHFDIDRVQASNIHLSLFQMLGAFEFGSTERYSPIKRLWSLLIDTYKISQENLWVTYFCGDKINGQLLESDNDAYQTWIGLGVNSHRILGLGKDSNFWKQSANTVGLEGSRKCGPYTEVYFDYGEERRCGPQCKPGCSCGRFVEFASILFISHLMGDEIGSLKPSPVPFSETVVGVERLSMLSQNKNNIFEIDNFWPLMEYIADFLEPSGDEMDFHPLISSFIIADHIRAVLFLAMDGAPPPGKGGRKRLMRILVRQTLTQMQLLNIQDDNFISNLMERLMYFNKELCPRLSEGKQLALEYFDSEISNFERVLDIGDRQLRKLINDHDVISENTILTLVKKYGMPFPLVKRVLTQESVKFDEEKYVQIYNSWMKKNRNNKQGKL